MSSAEQGFSLLEVVVATTILGFSLVAAYDVFSTGLRAAATAERQAKALVILEALSAQLGTVHAIEDGVKTGSTASGFQWTLEIIPYDEDVTESGRRLELPASPAALKQVGIQVSGPSGVIVDVTTLRLGVAQTGG